MPKQVTRHSTTDNRVNSQPLPSAAIYSLPCHMRTYWHRRLTPSSNHDLPSNNLISKTPHSASSNPSVENRVILRRTTPATNSSLFCPWGQKETSEMHSVPFASHNTMSEIPNSADSYALVENGIIPRPGPPVTNFSTPTRSGKKMEMSPPSSHRCFS
jgi:hypothetical protein